MRKLLPLLGLVLAAFIWFWFTLPPRLPDRFQSFVAIGDGPCMLVNYQLVPARTGAECSR
jgi:hypothetical protein